MKSPASAARWLAFHSVSRVEKLHWFDAQEDGQSLLHLCDADSAGWLEVYEILTEVGKESRLRADLQLEDFFVHVFLMPLDVLWFVALRKMRLE